MVDSTNLDLKKIYGDLTGRLSEIEQKANVSLICTFPGRNESQIKTPNIPAYRETTDFWKDLRNIFTFISPTESINLTFTRINRANIKEEVTINRLSQPMETKCSVMMSLFEGHTDHIKDGNQQNYNVSVTFFKERILSIYNFVLLKEQKEIVDFNKTSQNFKSNSTILQLFADVEFIQCNEYQKLDKKDNWNHIIVITDFDMFDTIWDKEKDIIDFMLVFGDPTKAPDNIKQLQKENPKKIQPIKKNFPLLLKADLFKEPKKDNLK